MDITPTRIETCEAGSLLGLVNLTLELGNTDAIRVADIRILKSDSGPVATLAPEFASVANSFSLSPALYDKVLATALDAYKGAVAQIAAAQAEVEASPSGPSAAIADLKAEREAYLKAYPARARTPQKWAAFRREWARRKQ